MAKIFNARIWHLFHLRTVTLSTCTSGSLTQNEIAAVLRPLYFAVHPDLFYQFPKEKEINENSLKQLNFYIEAILNNVPTNPVSLTFCLKNGSQNIGHSKSFKHVTIQLLGRNVRHVLRSILSTCHLPTEYLDELQKSRSKLDVNRSISCDEYPSAWWWEAQRAVEEMRSEPDIDFRLWLVKNIGKALHRLRVSQHLRDETKKLCQELKDLLELKDISWNCGWGITHFRGCLQSFRGLALQHPSEMYTLRGRTLVFGQQTGVSFEGQIILSSEDVRNNWLDMISSINQYDELLSQIPKAEKNLSEVLRGILVDHRKFQPTIMVQKYVQQLEKLIAALYKHRWVSGYPLDWPRRLNAFQIVVECEAGPLMLSPTGQFIVPASCPASVLVDFISRNVEEASRRLQLYTMMKTEEKRIRVHCMSKLGLSALEKDDNITPDLMVHCCDRILRSSADLNLFGLRLRVSSYYSILQDGEMCIPWNWKMSSR